MASEIKSEKISIFKYVLLDLYIRFYVLFDLILVVVIYKLVSAFHLITVNTGSLEDILNELISSTLSLAGFTLTALGLMVAMNDAQINPDVQPQRSFFFATGGFKKLLRILLHACVLFVALFVVASVMRGSTIYLEQSGYLFFSVFALVGLTFMTMLRCLYLLNEVICLR
jgi:hypothetical protein